VGAISATSARSTEFNTGLPKLLQSNEYIKIQQLNNLNTKVVYYFPTFTIPFWKGISEPVVSINVDGNNFVFTFGDITIDQFLYTNIKT